MARTEPLPALGVGVLALVIGLAPGCHPTEEAPATATVGSWSVTAWGEEHEIFAEVDRLVASRAAQAHVHVTVLDAYTPLEQGRVELRLVDASGRTESWARDEPARPGIFTVELAPTTEGQFDLAVVVRHESGAVEEIECGRIRVGTLERPGGPVVMPAPRGATVPAEPLSFLKEEQWRSDFATAWVRSGRLPLGISGIARVEPAAGNEVTLTAPLAAVASPTDWPHVGQAVAAGDRVLRLVPRIAEQSSLAALETAVRVLETELTLARAQAARQEELWRFEGTSRRELDEARSAAEALEARLEGARSDLSAARAVRVGDTPGQDVVLRAPFDGRVAEVLASPGEAIEAGSPLLRLLGTDRAWLALAVAPAAAAELPSAPEPVGLVARRSSDAVLEWRAEEVRWISRSPEIDAGAGTTELRVEIPWDERLLFGEVVEAELLLRSSPSTEAIVIPSSALVDDGGISIVYLQLSGESFVRQPVTVVRRQGEAVAVEGLAPGQRLVTRGGAALRRAALMATGDSHGHVH